MPNSELDLDMRVGSVRPRRLQHAEVPGRSFGGTCFDVDSSMDCGGSNLPEHLHDPHAGAMLSSIPQYEHPCTSRSNNHGQCYADKYVAMAVAIELPKQSEVAHLSTLSCVPSETQDQNLFFSHPQVQVATDRLGRTL